MSGLIPKREFGDRDVRPAWWPTTIDGQRKPFILCECGIVHGNIRNHRVHEDGHVTASFLCELPGGKGCGYHVFLTLDGWDGGDIPEGIP